jgi:hypothetical protein
VKQSWLLVLMVVSCGAMWAQDSKPPFTLTECRAVKELLLSHIKGENTESSALYKDLLSGLIDTQVCGKIDAHLQAQAQAQNQAQAQARSSGADLLATQAAKMEAFLKRHNLYDVYLAEEQGQQQH